MWNNGRVNTYFRVISWLLFIMILIGGYIILYLSPSVTCLNVQRYIFSTYEPARSNYYQQEASAWIGINNGELVFYPNEKYFGFHTTNNKKMNSIQNGQLTEINSNVTFEELFDSSSLNHTFVVGGQEYFIRNPSRYFSQLYEYSSDGLSMNKVNFGRSGITNIIPYKDGCFIRLHTNNEQLLLIDRNNNIVHIMEFNSPYSKFTFAINDNYIFISTDVIDNDLKHINQDTGLFRIDLLDYSLKKISNKFYDGLFLFGDGYIYASDKYSSIYKLDFNGGVVEEIYKVRLKTLFPHNIDGKYIFMK